MSAIKSAVVTNSAPAARNAVRHGLSGTHYVPAHARDHVAAIRREIDTQFRILLSGEQKIAEEMAICRWQAFEADRLLDERLEQEIAEAGLHYDRFLENERTNFQTILEVDPARGISLLKQNIYGNEALIGVWTEARYLVDQKLPFYTGLIKKMVAGLGSHWQLDKISHQALMMVSLCLATIKLDDTEVIAKQWLRELDPELHSISAHRLAEYRHRFGQMPDPLTQLLAIIEDNINELNEVKERLEKNLDRSIANFATAHAGQGMCDPVLMKEVALLQRYRTRALNRISKLESQIEKQRVREGRNSEAASLRQKLDEKETLKLRFELYNDEINLIEIEPAPMAGQVTEEVSQAEVSTKFTSLFPNKHSLLAKKPETGGVRPTGKVGRDLFEAPKDYSSVNFRIGG